MGAAPIVTRLQSIDWLVMEFVLPLLCLLALKLLWRWFKAPNNVGARGENRVAATLSFNLPDEYHIFNNIYLPLPNGSTTQIDHVVVSRYGVFVIETKTYSGWIFGHAKSSQWTQVLYKEKHHFQNPIRQNYRHVCALSDCLGIPKKMIKDMVVFNGNCKFKTEMPSKVMWRRDVAQYILSFSDVLLKNKEVSNIIQAINKYSDLVDEDMRKEHVSNIYKRHSAVSIDDDTPNCPYCGKRMVIRTNRKTGDRFYGCSRYPYCKGTVQIRV